MPPPSTGSSSADGCSSTSQMTRRSWGIGRSWRQSWTTPVGPSIRSGSTPMQDPPRPDAPVREGMRPSSSPEVWLRGAVPGFPRELMPVAHSLLQVREEIDTVVTPLSHEELWARPGGAASIGFHLKHLAGSLDRLLTYARGESLSEAQRVTLDAEERAGSAVEQPAILF